MNISGYGIAQEYTIQNGKIAYEYQITNQTGVITNSINNLYFSNDLTMFISNTEKGSNMSSESNKDTVDSMGTIRKTKIIRNSLTKFFFINNRTKKIIFRTSVGMENYTVRDTLTPISWQLYQEFKQVGEYKCQKATAPFRGRIYTVWFAKEIPVPYGPWKLNGLPGLILEASDHKGKYQYRALKMQFNISKEEIETVLALPKDVKRIDDMNVYIKAIQNECENTRSRALASLPKGATLMLDCDDLDKTRNRTQESF